jgi:hypothetical protein
VEPLIHTGDHLSQQFQEMPPVAVIPVYCFPFVATPRALT